MAKFNTTQTNKTVNKSGHAAYKMRDREKLVTQVLTSFFNEAKFYGDNTEDMKKTLSAVVKNDPKFVANLAVFARREFNMRSVSHVLAAYLAHEPQGKPYARRVVKEIAVRADDMTEVLSFYLNEFGKPIPNSLRKGIADAIKRFDAYSLAKYKGNGKAVKMRDLLCLCRPKPTSPEQSQLWNDLLNDKLETPYTWETELSAHGNNAKTWKKLIDSGKVGYMAQIRNLRNILNAKPSNIDKVLSYIANPEAVRRSKQLPFRFLAAYKEVQEIAGSRVFDALEDAVDASIANMPKLPGTTVIAVDNSGSMMSTISAKSKIRCYEIAYMLGLMANKICENSIFYTFNNTAKKEPISRRGGILQTALNGYCGGGTNMRAPFQEMLANEIKADRIIILSDNECNYANGWAVQTSADDYRRKTGRQLWVHAVDLQGYGTQQFIGKNTNIIAGWSEKVFEFIKLAEQGEGTLEKRIETYLF